MHRLWPVSCTQDFVITIHRHLACTRSCCPTSLAAVECSRCGPWRTHVECGCDYLHKHIRASNNNSAAQNKYK